MFNWIDNGKYITAINKEFNFFLYLDNMAGWFSIDILNDMDTENDFENGKRYTLKDIYLMLLKNSEIFSIKLWKILPNYIHWL